MTLKFCAIGLSILMLGKRISKKQRLSDWEVDTLSESQKTMPQLMLDLFKNFK